MTVNLDPLYNVVWAYNNKTGSISSYHTALATPSSDLHRSEVKESILTPELALPLAASTSVSRNQASLNMLSCLDTLTHYPGNWKKIWLTKDVLLEWFIHQFYPQNVICIQKNHFWPKNDGEKWCRIKYFEIPPWGKIVVFITEFVILGTFMK